MISYFPQAVQPTNISINGILGQIVATEYNVSVDISQLPHCVIGDYIKDNLDLERLVFPSQVGHSLNRNH